MADLVWCSRTITLLWGGSDDMKSDVNIVEIGQFGGLHIYVSGIGHGFVH